MKLQIGDKSKIQHWLIETNSFLIGEFIFILNADWLGRNNWMSKLIISVNSRQQILLKENRIKVVFKENRISKIVANIPVWFNWCKHLITFFIPVLLQTVSKIGIYTGLLTLILECFIMKVDEISVNIIFERIKHCFWQLDRNSRQLKILSCKHF